MKNKIQNKNRWKIIYWTLVLSIFIALIFLVRFVLNSSKVYVDQSLVIHPYMIEWPLERDGSLRINEPYYLKTDAVFIKEDLNKISPDSLIYKNLVLNPKNGGTLKDLNTPYLLWKNENSDTLHILKNNHLLNFLMVND